MGTVCWGVITGWLGVPDNDGGGRLGSRKDAASLAVDARESSIFLEGGGGNGEVTEGETVEPIR